MSGQMIIVILIVVIAALYVLRSFAKSLRKGGCATGCGKCSAPRSDEERPGLIKLPRV